MSGLIKTLIEIALTQKGVSYGATEIHQAVHDDRERGQTGSDEKLSPESILGPGDGVQGDRGKT